MNDCHNCARKANTGKIVHKIGTKMKKRAVQGGNKNSNYKALMDAQINACQVKDNNPSCGEVLNKKRPKMGAHQNAKAAPFLSSQ